MMMGDDMALVREFAASQSEPAFAALVRRHVSLVHSAALRQVGDAHLAEEIAQAVFIILARKARSLGPKTILSAWLYRTTRYTAADALKSRRRRQHREQEAHMQSILNEPDTDTWAQLAPLLDDAMAELGETDRSALVLRFFENKTAREIAGALRMGEAAAQKRVARALEKLRAIFVKRGVTLTAAALGGTIAANSVQAAPVVLAKSVTALAITKGAAASVSTLTLIKGALKIMAWTKAKTAIVVGVGVLLAAGTSTVAVKEIQKHQMYSWRVKGIGREEKEKLDTWPAQVWIKPAKDPHASNQLARNESGNKLMGRNTPFPWLLRNAYGKTQPWMVLPKDLTDDRGFDYMANLSHGSAEALQREINKTFGVVVRQELRETNVLILKIGKAGAHGIKPPTANPTTELQGGIDTLTWFAQPLSTLDTFLEGFFQTPILDQTGLAQKYDFAIQWDKRWWFESRNDPEGLKKDLLGQLGLELVPSREPIEMLVVEKAK